MINMLLQLFSASKGGSRAENTALDARFTAHYDAYIRPQVEAFEAKRCEAVATLRKRAVLVVVFLVLLGIVVAIVAPMMNSPLKSATNNADLVGQVVMALLVIAVGWILLPMLQYQKSIKTTIFPEIFRFFGAQWHYNPSGIGGESSADDGTLGDIEQVKRLLLTSTKARSHLHGLGGSTAMTPYMAFGIVPTHETASTEDYLTGDHRAVPITLFECTLTSTTGSGKNRRTTTHFKGLIITIDLPKRFTGHTTIRRDHGKIGNWFGNQFSGGLSLIKLEDPRFESRYEVYGTDQIEARYLLSTSFMERLVELEDLFAQHSGKKCAIQCAFKDGKILFTVPTAQEWFGTGSFFKPVDFIGEINLILKQMDQLFAIIDILKLDDKTGL